MVSSAVQPEYVRDNAELIYHPNCASHFDGRENRRRVCTIIQSLGKRLSVANEHEVFTKTILIPIYKSEQHIPYVFEYIHMIRDVVGDLEVVFVIDGSPDASEQKIVEIASTTSLRVQVIRLSRNFGVGPALHAGLSHVATDSVVIIGSDLQEPQELYIDFFRRLESGSADVCLGERMSRDDPMFMRLTSSLFWAIQRRLIDSSTPRGGFDGVGLSRKAVSSLVGLTELNTSFTSQLQWIGFRRVYVPFHRRRRISGRSSWTFRRRSKLFADSIYGFTAAPVTFLTVVGILGSLMMLILLLITGLSALMGWMTVPGFATLVILGAFGHSITLAGIGIVGGYIFRAFENTKQRPRYIIADKYELSTADN